MGTQIFNSINPATGETVATYHGQTETELFGSVSAARSAFESWRRVPVAERSRLIARAGEVLKENLDQYARMITLEMGKPIVESRAEVSKCVLACNYYAEHAAGFLADKTIETDGTLSFVRHDPIGAVLAIMPWNFPFWQVFRFAAPTLTAGNTGLLKHAPNVFGCATLIEGVFEKAGFPRGLFQNLIIHHDQIERLIAHDAISAVTLTGSDRAGSAVAEIAGRHIKKTLLELGGNNAFLVLEDADLDLAISTGVKARMLNCGQSCIAAKRFILVGSVYDRFVAGFTKKVEQWKSGDPMDEETRIGPLARLDLADRLQAQVQESIAQGAELLIGGKQDGCFHEPTVLGEVRPGMAAFDEETFGPLAAMIRAKNEEEAFQLSEQSKFGLGLTVCTTDIGKALRFAERVSDGAFFVNELVKSDPRLPFGGTKRSGYGRELGRDGMMEFVNRKTVYVK